MQANKKIIVTLINLLVVVNLSLGEILDWQPIRIPFSPRRGIRTDQLYGNENGIYANINRIGLFKMGDNFKWECVYPYGMGGKIHNVEKNGDVYVQVWPCNEKEYHIYKSSNGVDWIDLGRSFGFYNSRIRWVKIIDSNIAFGVNYRRKLCKTVNGGNYWFPLSLAGELSNSYIVDLAHLDNSNILYIAVDGKGVYKSIDLGENWIKIFTSSYGNCKIGVVSENEIYVAEGRKLYKTIDGGENWTEITFLEQESGISQILPLNENLVYLAVADGIRTNEGGIYKTTNGGMSWEAVNEGLIQHYGARDFCAVNSHVMFFLFGNFLYRYHTDSWEKISLPARGSAMALDGICEYHHKIYIGSGDPDDGYGKIYHQMGNWQEFARVCPDNPVATIVDLKITDNQVFYAFVCPVDFDPEGQHLDHWYRSIDKGVTWQKFGEGYIHPTIIEEGNVLFKRERDRQGVWMLYRSIDSGDSWEQVEIPIETELYFKKYCALSKNLIFLMYDEINRAPKFYKTTNGGNTWTEVELPCNPNYFTKMVKANEMLYLSTPYSVYKSTDAGDSWVEDLKRIYCGDIVLSEYTSSSGPYRGTVFVRHDSVTYMKDIEVEEVSTRLISEEKEELSSQSYPNPFNPECWIPVGNVVPAEAGLQMKIYNILGQLVREIKISDLRSQISKSVYWDGRDSQGMEVPSGVYFYEIGEEKVRRMVVLR
jgi:photosystem II stability/assembly factor-like uncharacterized protein